MIHILSVISWTGFSLGAYLLVKLSKIDGKNVAEAYHKIVIIEAISGLLILISGFSMALMLNFPSWTILALILVIPMAVLEIFHFEKSREAHIFGSMKIMDNFINIASFIWAILFFSLLYLMIFKPTITLFTS